jgi:hypothetical protein
MMRRERFNRFVVTAFVIGVLLTIPSCDEEDEKDPFNVSYEIHQLEFFWVNREEPFSPWGSVTLGYEHASTPLYFNLAVGKRWVVRNVPVPPSTERAYYTFGFDLGVTKGTEVTAVEYAYELTSDVLTTMPGDFERAPVTERLVVVSPGFLEGTPILRDPPDAEFGDAVVDSAFHTGEFPNTGAGDKECVPVAVSNSLKFLNAKYELGLTEDEMRIPTMKKATGWDPRGCGYEWYKTKDQYMRDNGYGVTTRKVTDFDQIIKEIKAGQDVELCGDWHCAAVTGIAKLANGKYVIYVAHDTAQGERGGEIYEKIMYDPETEKFEGSPGFFDGSGFSYFVVECPEKK